MRSGPDVRVFSSVRDLPDDIRPLLGGSFFASATWFGVVEAAGLPRGARAVYVAVPDAQGGYGIWPMMADPRGAVSALTTPYTALWSPGGTGNCEGAMRGFARWIRPFGCVRLDCMDAEEAGRVARGARRAGLLVLPFDHFGNWQARVDAGWDAYWRARPGHVREAVRRHGARLRREGCSLSLLSGPGGLEDGIAAYEDVYARSWKEAEPHPEFSAALMRACAAEGSLRLGLLRRADGSVLAAQIWAVHGSWASVLKLAHDEAARACSPGTVLTAWMIEQLVARDGIVELDFGRGDDAYKASWTDARRQRVGLVLVAPERVSAWPVLARHWAGEIWRFAQARFVAIRKRGNPPGLRA